MSQEILKVCIRHIEEETTRPDWQAEHLVNIEREIIYGAYLRLRLPFPVGFYSSRYGVTVRCYRSRETIESDIASENYRESYFPMRIVLGNILKNSLLFVPDLYPSQLVYQHGDRRAGMESIEIAGLLACLRSPATIEGRSG